MACWYADDELELIPTTPTTSGPYMAQHNADGTLTLTPVQEAEAVEPEPEVRRVPSMGEIWRDEDGELYLITDGYGLNGGRMTVTLTGSDYGAVGEIEECEDGQDDTFAYPSLAAAVTAGAIK